jgi:tetratricopeptide (TPR) repeat protein
MVEGLVKYYNDYGSVALKAGERGIARIGEAPTKTIILNPEDAVQWSLYYPGIISFRDYPLVTSDVKKLEELLKDAQKAVRDRPKDSESRILLAHIYHDLGERTNAKKEYQTILSADPSNRRARLGLGWLYLENNSMEDAAAELQKVKPPTAMSIVGLSFAAYRQDNFAASLSLIEQGLKTWPSSLLLRVQYAFLHIVSGKVKEAESNLKKVIENDPAYSYAYSLLSHVYLIQNKKGMASDFARQAITANPYSAMGHISRSLVFQAHFELDRAMLSIRPWNLTPKISMPWLIWPNSFLGRIRQKRPGKSCKKPCY